MEYLKIGIKYYNDLTAHYVQLNYSETISDDILSLVKLKAKEMLSYNDGFHILRGG